MVTTTRTAGAVRRSVHTGEKESGGVPGFSRREIDKVPAASRAPPDNRREVAVTGDRRSTVLVAWESHGRAMLLWRPRRRPSPRRPPRTTRLHSYLATDAAP